jgi:amidohydrolase
MDFKQRAQDAFSAVEAELRDISHWMYENPELGYEERESSARLAGFLEAQGMAVEYPAYGLETSFAARVGSAGPEVIVCAEYDALPEVGHACGHNIIATAAAGAGVALTELADELGCRITILGTPAEEALGGKVDVINAGAFAGASASMMVHPSPRNVLDPAMLAVSHIDVDFHGKASHAAFAPQLGINALDAAVQAYVNVSTLRQSLYPTDKIHGTFTYGGGAPNVIPAHTAMGWYVRAADGERLAELRDRVLDCFAAGAKATGCSWEYTQSGHPYEGMITDPVLAELAGANFTALGRTMTRGSDHPVGAAGSTDMGNVSQVVPAIHPMLGIDCAPAVNHQKEFADATVTPAGDAAIRDGALGMAWSIIDLATGDRWGELGAA